MEKLDLKKTLKQFYLPSSKEVTQVEVPGMNYLMIDGHGDPNTSELFSNAVETLFSISYTLKFMVKKGSLEIDYAVMPLEGLWWTDDMTNFSVHDKSNWLWTLMIMQPDFVTKEMVAQALDTVEKKKNISTVNVRFESFSEGLSAQILHIGPFSEEGPTVEKIHRYIDARGVRTGKHHEIYLSDTRKTAPSKWKTVIRQPMK